MLSQREEQREMQADQLLVRTQVPAPGKISRWQGPSAALLVFGPLVGLVLAVVELWHHGVGWFDLGLGAALYAVTGHGLTVGFHRLLTHGSFHARRGLKVALAVAGSMGVEGSVFTWVAQHRRHHAYADREGDPHSPWACGAGFWPQCKGLWHAHAGWFFRPNPSEPERWIPDLLADRDLRLVSNTAAIWAAASLALPFVIGWAVTGTPHGAWLALLWAGVVRMALLHHVTWSVNSVTHMFGRRPFRTRDSSSNVGALAVLSMGESWHNAHHAYPTLARHGVDPGQIDSSAALIRVFERLGWATEVRWATKSRTAARRLDATTPA
ncbi:MAG: acyl-CoA desaturase [Acidimicrobiales bacterium]